MLYSGKDQPHWHPDGRHREERVNLCRFQHRGGHGYHHTGCDDDNDYDDDDDDGDDWGGDETLSYIYLDLYNLYIKLFIAQGANGHLRRGEKDRWYNLTSINNHDHHQVPHHHCNDVHTSGWALVHETCLGVTKRVYCCQRTRWCTRTPA